MPIVLLVGIVSAFLAMGGSLVSLLGRNPPQPDVFDIRRVEFKPGQIRVRVTNPQTDDLTVASVTVDDAIVPFELDGPAALKRLRSTTILIPYQWVEDDPISVGVTSSSGIETTQDIAAAVETPSASPSSFFGYGIIGLLVGVLPVALGLGWLPSLRRLSRKWLAAFMSLTAGLLVFLAVEALTEALQLQQGLPSPLGGTGLVLVGLAVAYLGLVLLSRRFSSQGNGSGALLGGVSLATLVAVGIGIHNLGEGLAIGSSFAFGELTLGTFLIVGFMIHNITEGIGIAAPAAEGRAVGLGRLALLALIAGGPTIAGAWIGGFIASDLLGVLFFAGAAGAAFQVVIEVGRYVARVAPAGLTSPHVIGGFLAGLVAMYATGLLAG
ncbi:MAG TPA: hypothetical protein VF895_10065 [Gaiellaceae bacterium]